MKNLSFILSLFCIVAELNAQWVNPNNKRACVIYYEGSGNSQVEGFGYMVNRGFKSPTTGEYIVCNKGIDIIPDIWVDPEIAVGSSCSAKRMHNKKNITSMENFSRAYDP